MPALSVNAFESDLLTYLLPALSDRKELITLVNLAMVMAQSQGDYEVEKVTCLQTSVMGYAPLIFDLQANRSLERFRKLCQDVWLLLDEDPKLPDKFVSICSKERFNF